MYKLSNRLIKIIVVHDKLFDNTYEADCNHGLDYGLYTWKMSGCCKTERNAGYFTAKKKKNLILHLGSLNHQLYQPR